MTDLIGSGPQAERSKMGFRPDAVWQEQQLETAFLSSGGEVTYLGDWHSHPHGSGVPSRQDRRTAKRIAEYADAQVPAPLILILSLEDTTWKAQAYIYERRALRQCRVVRYFAFLDQRPPDARAKGPSTFGDREPHVER